ncbi:hypothetical protein GOODEAATRI_021173 [Goodea atripinnis]|uniref:G-protein coupled receptors family 3 profile domain-containing protein n=1 Tax=Goodea atripinnis TaxID=208336 RepID=A0ABV0N444_9TELE
MTPQGCGPNLDSLYYNLCDLSAAWGVVLEALAAAGIVFSFVLFISILASLPFINSPNHKTSVALNASFLFCTAGLFCLTFAFICVRLNILARRNAGPRAWVLWLGALGLWLVEVIINTEWLIITVVRNPQPTLNATTEPIRATATPCNIANQDFVMALIYVMALILAVVVASLPIMAGKYAEWKKEGALILVISLISVGIWVAWIVMYVYGNERTGSPTWDDPTLAIALVANAWVFIIFYTIPQICCLNSDDETEEEYTENAYANRGVGYETILKEHNSQKMFMENKAFSMDEPGQGMWSLYQSKHFLKVFCF